MDWRRATILVALGSGVAAPTAFAQGPDVLEYTFNAGDLTNTASPGSGAAVGVNGGGVLFRPGGVAFGPNDPAGMSAGGSTVRIRTGWSTDLGGGDWTIGFFLDLRPVAGGDPNDFQYLFGDASAGDLRAFVDGAAGDGNVMLRGPFADVVIAGGGSEVAPVHVCWVHDALAGEIRGYLDGTLVNTVAQGPVFLQGDGATSFHVMGHNASFATMRAGTVMDEFRVYRRAIGSDELASWVALSASSPVGTHYCTPGTVNSTGQPARITATGSDVAAANDVTLRAHLLPQDAFGYFLASRAQAFVPNPGGSVGDLCLGGSLGRYRRPNEVGFTGAAGSIALTIDLTSMPTSNGPVAAQAGETWNFQVWYRDAVGGAAVSNFSDALAVTLR